MGLALVPTPTGLFLLAMSLSAGTRISQLRRLAAEYEPLRSAESPDEPACALLSSRERQVLVLVRDGATIADRTERCDHAGDRPKPHVAHLMIE
jgi:hypothetical protein